MAKCDKCGNDYDKSFKVQMNGTSYTFDSFECAISMAAPRCKHCETAIIGHGVESNGSIYCCSHCAEKEGVKGLVDRI
jgi:hypothetical protein